MMGTETDGRDRLSKIRRYRRVMVAFVLGGSAGFVVASEFGYPLVGVAVYWASCLAFVGIWQGTSVTLFDERERALEERASLLTLNIIGAAGVAAWPALIVLDELGHFTFPPALNGVLLAFPVLYGLFGIVYLWLRYRP